MQIQSDDLHQPSGSWQVRDSPANPAQKQICDVCDKLRQKTNKNQRFVSAKPEAKVDPRELVKEVPVQPHLQFHRVKS